MYYPVMYWQALPAAAIPLGLGLGLPGWATTLGLVGLFLATLRVNVTGGIRHGNVLPLVYGLGWIFIHHTMLWGIFSYHQNNLVACPITVGDICYALKSIVHPESVGQIMGSQCFDATISSIDKVMSWSSGLLARSRTW